MLFVGQFNKIFNVYLYECCIKYSLFGIVIFDKVYLFVVLVYYCIIVMIIHVTN